MENRIEKISSLIDEAFVNGENIEMTIASLVFDKEHAKNLKLRDVIDYLSDWAERLKVEDTPAVSLMLEELGYLDDHLRSNNEYPFDYDLLKESLSEGLSVLESLMNEVKEDKREIASWRSDPKSFLAGVGVAASLALLVSVFKRKKD